MTFDKFKHIVDLMIQNRAKLSESYDLGINLMEFSEGYDVAINYLWGEILTVEGLDWFDWFMNEKNYLHDGKGNLEIQAFSTTNGEQTEICKDLEGLYNYLKENNYFTCESQK